MLTPAAAPTPRQSVLAAEEVGNRALIGVTKQVTDLGSVELQRPGVCICWVASTCRWNAPPNAWRKRSAPGRVNPNWPQDDGLDSSERRNTQSVEVVVEEPETSKKVPGPAPLTKQREEHARLIARGVSNSEACRTVEVNRRTGTRWLYGRTVPGTNGFTREYPPVNSTLKPSAPRSIRYLSEEDRGVIADMRRAKASMRAIALAIERDVSTISRELARNTDDSGRYRPSLAQQLATRRLARPRARKVATDPILAAVIQGWLDSKWSPEQISNSLLTRFPGDPSKQLATESIYQALYAKCPVLQRDPTDCLRTGRRRRRPHRRGDRRRPNTGNGRGSRRPIAERPADAEDRQTAGHWEGDLITGRANKSAIATLVERASGFTILVHLPGSHTAEVTNTALVAAFSALPEHLRKSLGPRV